MIEIRIRPLSGSEYLALQHTIVELHDAGHKIKTYESKRDWNKAIDCLNNVASNKNFTKSFNYQDVNIWQFYHSYVVADFLYLLDLSEIFQIIISDYAFSKKIFVTIPGDRYSEPTADLCNLFFPECAVKILHLESALRINAKKMLRIFQIPKFLRSIEIFLKKTILLIPKIFLKNKRRDNNVLFISQCLYAVKDEGNNYYDRVLDSYIVDAQSRGYRPVGIDCVYNWELKNIFKSLNRAFKDKNSMQWTSFSSYKVTSSNSDKVFNKRFINWLSSYSSFSKDEFIVLSIIKRLHHGLHSEIIAYLKQAEIIIDSIKPIFVFAAYETGPFSRSLILMANKNKVPTFGVQHGMIFPNHSDYMHANTTTTYKGDGFIIPDKTFVYGSFWKEVLCKSGRYPESNVVIAGNDWVNYYCKKGKIQNQDYVLILYVGFTVGEELQALVNCVREMFNNKKIVIKAHPSLCGNEFYKIAQDVSYIVDTPDLYDLIYNSYCCISEISTAALEMFVVHPIGGFVINFNKLPGWELLEQFNNCYVNSIEELQNNLLQYKESATFRNGIKQDCKSRIFSYYNSMKFKESIQFIYSMASHRC